MNTVINPHDCFFRETFGRKEIAAGFLKEYLPQEIMKMIDLDSMRIVKDSFIEKELRHHFSDLLYTVQHRQGPLYLYLLFEHKSSPDPWVALQLLRYMVRIWELHRKQNPKVKKLPAVLPLVLYHGRQKWRISPSFRELILQDDPHLKPFLPDFRYQLHDLSTLSDEQIRGEVLGRITLLLLKHIFDPELADQLPGILSLLQKVGAGQDTLEILEILLRYVVKATGRFDEDDIKTILSSSFIEEDIVQTFIDKYIEQGMQQGIQQGMQQGMQQGGNKILTAQLKKRFGTLPGWVEKKIAEADVSAIEEWSLNLLSASTIDEVFH